MTAVATTPGLRRNSSLSLAGSAVGAAAQFLLVLVVARGLSPPTAGAFYAVTSLFMLALVVVRLGTPIGLVYFSGRSLRVALPPVLVASTLIAGLAFAAAPWLSGSLRVPAEAIRMLAPFLPVAALGDAFLAASRGRGSMRATVLVDNLARPLLQLLLVSAAILGDVVWIIPLAWASPWIAAAVLAFVHVRPMTDDRGDARSFWGYTWSRAVAALPQAALQRLDIVLVAALLGPAPAAVYTAATRLKVVGQLANQALTQAAQPLLTGARDDRVRMRAIYQTSTAWLVLLTWPFWLLIGWRAPDLLDIFGYAAPPGLLWILAATMLVATALGMVDMVLIMSGRTLPNLVDVVFALLTMVVSAVVLMPRYGVIGAIFAWSAGIAVKNLLPLAQIWRTLGLHPFGRRSLAAMALAATCFGPVYLIGWPAFLAGLTIYAAAIWRRRTFFLP